MYTFVSLNLHWKFFAYMFLLCHLQSQCGSASRVCSLSLCVFSLSLCICFFVYVCHCKEDEFLWVVAYDKGRRMNLFEFDSRKAERNQRMDVATTITNGFSFLL